MTNDPDGSSLVLSLINEENFSTETTIFNDSLSMESQEYIFDKFYIRAIFISLYSIVFALCFFGNLLVILVVTMSRRLRSITNFFLANLAVADFCVAIFCVYQNLLIYIVENWLLGDFLCKMYMFIQSLSSTASIFILVVICTERYFAILYPITCKQILTSIRLKLIICGVWSVCILYSSPKFYWGDTVTIGKETVCVLNRQLYNSKWFDMTHFVLFYILPLGVMSLLYTRIAICLWNSSQQLKRQLDASSNSSQYQTFCRTQSIRTKQDKFCASNGTTPCATPVSTSSKLQLQSGTSGSNSYQASSRGSPSCSENVLRARKGVIRMLIFVVVAFAVCNLPIHARKMWQYWSTNYHGNSNFSALFTPLTFLCTYFNSGVNPLLYAFLSKNFRRGMREILFCTLSRKKRSPSLHHRMSTRRGRGVFHRNGSSRSTLKGGNNMTTVTIVQECSSDEV
ncbi:trissin receptor-like [Anthonomus grandis grandis]|uniref:trissin receptor-like n=1 Tax=Anthonomus grandis grandis TaxID=2921223 RepID=UPI002165D202|nr:trissin receptor-like [Anthonomus grandis grandis]